MPLFHDTDWVDAPDLLAPALCRLLNRLYWHIKLRLRPPIPYKRPLDDFEPYCSESILQRRELVPKPISLFPDEHKAIKKIGARYGAKL